MPVKEVPVPTGDEVQEPQEEQAEDVSVETLPELVPEPKRVKKEDDWTNVTKRKAKAKKEEEKVDLKQRMPCPICKKNHTLHCLLLYTHQCTKDARAAKQKKSTVHGGDLELSPEKVIEKPVPFEIPEIVPVDPPLIREPRQLSYKEALLERRYAIEARQREIHTTPIRNYFGRF